MNWFVNVKKLHELSDSNASVTHTNTVARIVICLQDGSRRFPVFGASFPNVGQTRNEIHNRVRTFICFYMR